MKTLVIVFAVVIAVLLGVLVFFPSAKGPAVSQNASSTAPASSTGGAAGGGGPAGGGATGGGTAGGFGTVQGRVLLGPTCPVERIPPDPACAPRPYQTSIAIARTDAASQNGGPPVPYKTIQSDSSGAFSVSLPAGSYVFHAQGASIYPLCKDQTVVVKAGQTNNTVIDCDTGIR